jgi:arylsulfatase A
MDQEAGRAGSSDGVMTNTITRRQLLIQAGAGTVDLLSSHLFGAWAGAEGRRPNFVLILGEGQGWSSTSVQMDDTNPASRSDSVRTPNLERLSREGMRLANFYAPSPRCTPSRAAMLTGKSPALLHMTFIGEGRGDEDLNAGRKLIPPSCILELPANELTIANVLQKAGYTTAHFGKWHVGRVSPIRHGFDESDGANSNRGPENVENPNPKQAQAINNQGIDFVTRQAKAGKPFYLQLSHYGRNDDPTTFGVVDAAIGKLLDALGQLGLADNTYVIYTTDHGTPGRNPPLAGGKGTIWEGGLRVPFIIRGPGIRPGACRHVQAHQMDLLPTIAELAQAPEPLPRGLEGGSIAAVLKNSGNDTVERPREEFVVHFPHYDKDVVGPASAIYLGDFKLVRIYETGSLRLFNIAKDPGERRDLDREMPEKVKELDDRLTDYLAAVAAQMPTTNPNYDPTKSTDVRRGGTRRRQQ